MREHQIVITLKPEQFLEVQRMARLAGAKSMGMFVRQKLLSVLGMEGTRQPPDKLTGGPDVKKIAGDLRRLHGELKTFVAESLASAYVDQVETVLSKVDDPLGVNGLTSGFLPGVASPDLPLLTNVEQTMAEFEHARDELEQIAQRAFAISPRLGPMEDLDDDGESPPEEDRPKSSRDPLDDLLEDPLMTRIDDYMSRARGEEPERKGDDKELVEYQDDIDDEDGEEVFDVPLPLSDRSSKPAAEGKKSRESSPQPPSTATPPAPPGGRPPPGGISGGPPPRRRQ